MALLNTHKNGFCVNQHFLTLLLGETRYRSGYRVTVSVTRSRLNPVIAAFASEIRDG